MNNTRKRKTPFTKDNDISKNKKKKKKPFKKKKKKKKTF